MLHVEEVDRLDVVALLAEVRRELFKQLALGIGDEHGLSAIRAANKERDDKTAGFAAARRADAQQVVVLARLHLVRNAKVVLGRIILVRLVLAEHHALDLRDGRHLQE